MATVCSHCGKDLPRGGDARFCTNCGMLVSDHPSDSPAAQIAKDDAAPANKMTSASPNVGWREQLAEQPPVRTPQPQDPNVTPWFGVSGSDAANVTPWHGIQGQDLRNVSPKADTQRDAQETIVTRPENEKGEVAQTVHEDVSGTEKPGAARPASNPAGRPGSVRQQGASRRLVRQNMDAQMPVENIAWPKPINHIVATDGKQTNASNIVPVSEPPVEDFPTSIIASSSIAADQSASKQYERHDRQQHEEIDQMPTALIQVREQRPATSGSAVANAQRNIDISRPEHQHSFVAPPPVVKGNSAYVSDNVLSVEDTPTISIAGRKFETQAASATATRSPYAPRKNVRSLLFAVAVIIIVIALGIGSWIIFAQPFAVPVATNPLQTTSNVPLGLTIAYPAGWKSAQTSTSLTLVDSSNTAQMKITQPATASTDQASYLKQQAANLGMTDAQAGSAASFAGSSWQQIHGDFTINGAGYVGTIYVTEHNNHMYTLMQMAPKVTFQDEESLVFAPSRASLKFS